MKSRTLGAREQLALDRVLASLRRDAYAELARTFQDAPARGFLKYIKHPEEILANVVIALVRLGLDRPPALRVLDISAGVGLQAMAYESFGHAVYTTDAIGPEQEHASRNAELLVASCRFFGRYAPGRFQQLTYMESVPCTDPKRYLMSPLPDFGVTFDLITAIAVSPMSWWDEEQWRLFLADCASHAPEGRIYVKPNSGGYGQKALLAVVGSAACAPGGGFTIFAKDWLQ